MLRPTDSLSISSDYYYKVADYYGCVHQINQEISDITVHNYQSWYFKNYGFFVPQRVEFSERRKLLRFKLLKHSYLSVEERKEHTSKIFASSRVRSLLSYSFCMWRLRKRVNFFINTYTNKFKNQFESGYNHAPDKYLYLAKELKGTADKLLPYISQFQNVRADISWMTSDLFIFNPRKFPADKPSQVGITIATIQHFVLLLARFQQEMLPIKPGKKHPVSYLWPTIDKLAEQIELWADGEFLVSKKYAAAAGAGFIDALREAELLPKECTLPILYEAFSVHYKCSIKADRMTDTRQEWHDKARKAIRA